MTTNRIRLMVADNHEVVRTGLKAIGEPEEDIDVVPEAGSAQEASRMADTFDPSVVLMDVHMKGMNGIEDCRIIKSAMLRPKLNKS
ncbi:MAG: response regulator transcription factor [SAR202 cluster bacterium]|nr:response regulator transcription factor [SAR202 cluster bacterium]